LQFEIGLGYFYIRIPGEKTEDGYERAVDFVENLERELAEKGIPHKTLFVSGDRKRIGAIIFSLREAGTKSKNIPKELVERSIYAEDHVGNLINLRLGIGKKGIFISNGNSGNKNPMFLKETAFELGNKEIFHYITNYPVGNSQNIGRIFFLLKKE